jgi:hydroxyacylglutathione hydrolase
MVIIEPIPAFADNYIWLLHRAGSREAVVVDPGDAKPVLRVLAERDLPLSAILITHHHGDHTGGIRGLTQHFPGVTVYGPARETIAGLTRRLREGDVVEALGASFQVMEVPGHTAGHIAYYGEGALFCGDTVFACGCGRLFEGTAEQMHASLSKIATLPGDTLVYCAHEYTLANIGFAKWVEPNNPDLLQRERDDQARRGLNLPTVPSRLDLERGTNPFLRSAESTVIQAAEAFAGHPLKTGAEVFGTVRYWKDSRYD